MIRTKISAVASVTYGLLSALIITVIVGSLSGVGIGVEKVFSAAGNAISATAGGSTSSPSSIGAPNSVLEAYQQSQITNATAEIAAGTASAACLQNMNSSANAASMVSNNATCLGPGYGVAPPALPIAIESNGSAYVETNGAIYAEVFDGEGNFSTTSATEAVGSNSIILYKDGTECDAAPIKDLVKSCQTAGGIGGYPGSGTATVIGSNEVVCSGIANTPGSDGGSGSNPSTTAPFGYLPPW